VRMLDEIGLQKALGMESCVSLFGDVTEFLHTTSAIRYPTFVRGRNYTGTRRNCYLTQCSSASLNMCWHRSWVPCPERL
jgi:hypothetical protein